MVKATSLKIGDTIILKGLKTIQHYKGLKLGQIIEFGADIKAEVISIIDKPSDSLFKPVCRVKIDPEFRRLFQNDEMDLFSEDEVEIVEN